jgi:dihydrofolate synthase/folylpolyglutamate synthase
MIFGAMADKNLEEIAAILFPVAKRLILTQLANPRAATVETLQKFVAVEGAVEVQAARSVAEAINIAKQITPDGDLICITGSLYLVGDTQAALRASDISSLNSATHN